MDVLCENSIVQEIDELDFGFHNYYENRGSEIENAQKLVCELRSQNELLAKENAIFSQLKHETERSQGFELHLSQEISALKAEAVHKDERIVELRLALESYKNQYTQFVEERKKTDQQALGAVEESFRLEVEMQRVQLAMSQLQDEVLSLKQSIEQKNTELETTQQNQLQLAETLKETEAMHFIRQGTILDLEKNIDALNQCIVELRQTICDGAEREALLKNNHQNEVLSSQKKFDDETRKHQDLVAALQAELEDEKDKLGVELAMHENEVTDLDEKIAGYQATLGQCQDELDKCRFELEETKLVNNEKLTQFQLRVEAQELALRTSQQESLESKNEVTDLGEKILGYQATLSQCQDELDKCRFELEETKLVNDEKLTQFQLRVEAQELALRTSQQESLESKNEVAALGEKILGYQATLSQRQDELDKCRFELKQTKLVNDEKLKQFQMRMEAQEIALKASQQESFDRKNELAQQKATRAVDLANLNAKFEAEKREWVMRNHEIQEQNEILRRDFSNGEEKISELMQVIDCYVKNISMQQQELAAKQVAHEAEKAQWSQEIQVLTEQLAAETQDKSRQVARFAEREKQVDHYYDFVKQEKTKYQKVLQQLARQIHYAVTLHPLQDYLVVTEKELSRIECELKKTPSISPHRKQMEAMVDQFVQQRDLIRDLILKSEKSLSQQTESLERLARGVLATATPPPPQSL
jgi:chromosome segregation ATPase